MQLYYFLNFEAKIIRKVFIFIIIIIGFYAYNDNYS